MVFCDASCGMIKSAFLCIPDRFIVPINEVNRHYCVQIWFWAISVCTNEVCCSVLRKMR